MEENEKIETFLTQLKGTIKAFGMDHIKEKVKNDEITEVDV